MGKCLKRAVSAGQVGKRGIDVRAAVLQGFGDDLFDRAALLGIAQVTVRWHLAAGRAALSRFFTEDRR